MYTVISLYFSGTYQGGGLAIREGRGGLVFLSVQLYDNFIKNKNKKQISVNKFVNLNKKYVVWQGGGGGLNRGGGLVSDWRSD